MRFSQARLLVDDFAAAFRFYRDTLGFTAASGDESSVYASFDTGSGMAGKDEHVVRAPVDKPDWGGRVAFLRDPSGNLIELFQSLPQQE